MSRRRSLHHQAHASHRLVEARPRHRLQQVVERIHVERLHGVIIVGSSENEKRQAHLLLEQPFDDAETIQARHLDVQENQLRVELADEAHCLEAVLGPAHDLNVWKALQQKRKLVTGWLFVIHDERRDLHERDSLSASSPACSPIQLRSHQRLRALSSLPGPDWAIRRVA